MKRGVFSHANGLKDFYVESPGLNHTSCHFRTFFFMNIPVWVTRGSQVCFLLSSKYKNLISENAYLVFSVSVKQNIKMLLLL